MEPSQPDQSNDIKSLKQNPKNPRRISNEDFAALQAAIDKFGDISGIIFNETTGQLVGGHQRVEAFKKLPNSKKIIITKRYEIPTQKGTVAIGYVQYGEEFFGYRVVQWQPEWEAAANIAANRISGEWDLDKLAEMNYELAQFDNSDELLTLSGQTDREIDRLAKAHGFGDDEQVDEMGESPRDSDKLEFRLTVEQREIVEEALEHVKASREIPSEENGSRNGSALYYMAREHLDRLHGLTDGSSE